MQKNMRGLNATEQIRDQKKRTDSLIVKCAIAACCLVVFLAILLPRANKPEQAAPALTSQAVPVRSQTAPAEAKTNAGTKVVTFTIKPVFKLDSTVSNARHSNG